MSRSLQLLVVLLLAAGCVRGERFRPRYEARRIVEAQLGCPEVEVSVVPRSPYRDEPLDDRRLDLVAWGCGHVARLRCSPFGTVGGACEADPTYEAPERPAAIVKVRGRYASLHGVAQRERIVIDGAEVVRHGGARAIAIPVSPGPARWEIETHPVHQRIEHYTTRSERRIGDRVYTRTELHERVVREPGVGCGQRFTLSPAPGAIYRVALDVQAPGHCEVYCAREVPTGAGVQLTACEGFGPAP